MPSDRNRIVIVAIALIVAFIVVFAFPGSYYSNSKNDTGSYRNQSASNTVINVYTTLVANIVANNLTIESNVVLVTNGFSIFCNGTFINYGTIVTGNSPDINYPDSYGGSGGGAWQAGNSTLTSSSGGNTLSYGGSGSDTSTPSSNNGHHTKTGPLTESVIQNWYNNGFTNYLSGARGQSAANATGGSGSYGLYVQAESIFNRGFIVSAGQAGIPNSQPPALSGGGGGGVVLFAYGNQILNGTVATEGGTGGYYNGVNGVGGHGGSGQVVEYRFTDKPPVNVSGVPGLVLPVFAFNGARANYTVTQSINNITDSVKDNVRILHVNRDNETFTFRETFPFTGGNVRNATPAQYTVSFTEPSPFPALYTTDMKLLRNGEVPSGLVFGASNAIVTPDVHITVPAGSYKTIEVSFSEVGVYGNIWVDSSTGLIVKEVYSDGFHNSSTSLDSTNIVMHTQAGTDYLPLTIEVASAFGAILVLTYFVFRIRRNGNENFRAEDNNKRVYGSRALKSRQKELKSMLEKGVITEEYYQECLDQLFGRNN